jgi:NADH-quinone oxidoreductase subunit H
MLLGFGLLQPIADGLKLIVKEPVLPTNANLVVLLAYFELYIQYDCLDCHSFGENIALADFNIGILYIFAVSSLGVYGIITSGGVVILNMLSR